MTLRKIAGLLAAFGLTLGLIGGGVGAVFQDQVTATQSIDVGAFACKIVSATPGAASDGIALDGKSLTFASPTIMSSAAGSAPFSFTVQNTGSINQQLSITVGGPNGSLSTKFSAVALAPASPVALAAGASQAFNTGIQWTTLDSTDLGDSGSFTWTVNCGENAPAPIFDNVPAVLAANYPSIGPEAYSYKEFGTQVQFAGTARQLSTATVTMSSWACETGSWNLGTCATTPGATFTTPITFNVYSVGSSNAVGALVATKTQTFTIPYRPSADATNCTGGNAGKWFNGTACYNGKAVNITFTFAGETLPNTAIFGITFNTTNHGYAPLGGSNNPTDSLNVGMYPGTGDGTTAVAPAVGAFLPDGVSAYLNSTFAGFYLDNGVGGTGTFRLDTGPSHNASQTIGPYGGFQPAVEITAAN